MDATLIATVVGIIFLGSMMRAIFGFGDSVVSMPLLALLPISFSTSVSLVGLAGFTVAVLTILSGWRNVDRSVLLQLSLATLVGIPFGLALVALAPKSLITSFLSVFLILYGSYSLISPNLGETKFGQTMQGPIGTLSFGFGAGMLGSAYNMNGIPIVVYGTMRKWNPTVFRETLQAHFLVSSIMIIFGHFLGGFWTTDLFVLYGFSVPAIALAIWLGNILYNRIPSQKFKRYIFILIILLGIFILFD